MARGGHEAYANVREYIYLQVVKVGVALTIVLLFLIVIFVITKNLN